MKTFDLVQKGTGVPKENVEELGVTVTDLGTDEHLRGVLFVGLPDYWIQIDTNDQTFAVGAYEG